MESEGSKTQLHVVMIHGKRPCSFCWPEPLYLPVLRVFSKKSTYTWVCDWHARKWLIYDVWDLTWNTVLHLWSCLSRVRLMRECVIRMEKCAQTVVHEVRLKGWGTMFRRWGAALAEYLKHRHVEEVNWNQWEAVGRARFWLSTTRLLTSRLTFYNFP